MNIASIREARVLKNIPGRTIQLGFVGLAVSIGISIYFYLLGLTMSAVMVGCFAVALAGIILLQWGNVIKATHHLIIFSVCALLLVSGFVEGSRTGQFFYFFPLIVVIPIVVDSKDSARTELIATFAVVLVSFALCFYFGHTVRPMEYIPAAITQKVVFSNALSAMLVTLLFAVANIVYERKFARALQNIAHIQSHEVRRPVASIMGLMDIWKKEDYRYDAEIIGMMEDAVNELDEKIHLIVQHSSHDFKSRTENITS